MTRPLGVPDVWPVVRIEWSAKDIQALAPQVSVEQAEAWLLEHDNAIREIMQRAGGEVLQALVHDAVLHGDLPRAVDAPAVDGPALNGPSLAVA